MKKQILFIFFLTSSQLISAMEQELKKPTFASIVGTKKTTEGERNIAVVEDVCSKIDTLPTLQQLNLAAAILNTTMNKTLSGDEALQMDCIIELTQQKMKQRVQSSQLNFTGKR